MALEKQTVTDRIEIVQIEGTDYVQVQEAINILEDGVKLSTSYHRYTVSPGEDYSERDAKVRAICDVVFAAS